MKYPYSIIPMVIKKIAHNSAVPSNALHSKNCVSKTNNINIELSKYPSKRRAKLQINHRTIKSSL